MVSMTTGATRPKLTSYSTAYPSSNFSQAVLLMLEGTTHSRWRRQLTFFRAKVRVRSMSNNHSNNNSASCLSLKPFKIISLYSLQTCPHSKTSRCPAPENLSSSASSSWKTRWAPSCKKVKIGNFRDFWPRSSTWAPTGTYKMTSQVLTTSGSKMARKPSTNIIINRTSKTNSNSGRMTTLLATMTRPITTTCGWPTKMATQPTGVTT
mmetsp:Transcript_5899/g.7996  ORF Transcript_5899/g.7996 Transcript_5899/m.7996 type:complete len:208 (+) Transcript_5899:226-849(+)